jgi:hypothetical protein
VPLDAGELHRYREPGEPADLAVLDVVHRIALQAGRGVLSAGWAELWLAGVGAGVAVAIGALVGAVALPGAMSGTRDALWAVTGGGMAVLILCLAGYFTQRRDHGKEIAELRKDMENHKPRSSAS